MNKLAILFLQEEGSRLVRLASIDEQVLRHMPHGPSPDWDKMRDKVEDRLIDRRRHIAALQDAIEELSRA